MYGQDYRPGRERGRTKEGVEGGDYGRVKVVKEFYVAQVKGRPAYREGTMERERGVEGE